MSVLRSVCWLSCALVAAAGLPPVILLNGLAGSVFKAKLNRSSVKHFYCSKKTSDFYTLWINAEELIPGASLNCLFDNMALHYDTTTNEYSDTPGVQLDTSVDFGGVGGLDELDPGDSVSGYFHDIIARLELQGYQVGKDLHGAPYDWRLAPDGLKTKPILGGKPYFQRLQELVEDTVEKNGRAAVVLTHSMGGPVGLSFLNSMDQGWKDKHIARFVPMAPPFGGASSGLKAVVSGDDFSVPFVPHDILHPIQSTCASGPWLFPTHGVWQTNETLVTAGSNRYGVGDYPKLMQDLGLQAASTFVAHGVPNMTLARFTAPGVPVNVFRGSGKKTESTYVYKDPFRAGKVPAAPTAMYDYNGDGTVNDRSLARASVWVGQQPQPVNITTFSGVSHFGILTDKTAIAALVDLLQTI